MLDQGRPMSTETPGWAHPSALLEDGVVLGPGTKVWDNVHIRHGARLGRDCIVGEKTYIAYNVPIGDYVKINANVYICAEVEIQDFVMIAAHTVFTNDLYPRSGNLALDGLETSDVTEETLKTRVRRGVTIGANATIGPGIELGEFSMVGMGSVVTKDIPPHTLVMGNPARPKRLLCRCGHPLFLEISIDQSSPLEGGPEEICAHCERTWRRSQRNMILVKDPFAS